MRSKARTRAKRRVAKTAGVLCAIGLSVFLLTRDIGFWLTPDQQGDWKMSRGEYAEAANTYESPLRAGAAWYGAKEYQKAAAEFGRSKTAEAHYNRGNSLVLLGKYDDAISQFLDTLEMERRFPPALLFLGMAYTQIGRPVEAAETLEFAVDVTGGAALYTAALAHAYAESGRGTEAERLLVELEARFDEEYVPADHIAVVHLALGHRSEAFIWLERGYRERDPLMVIMKAYPLLDPLRSDPRFDDLLRRIGFPE